MRCREEREWDEAGQHWCDWRGVKWLVGWGVGGGGGSGGLGC